MKIVIILFVFASLILVYGLTLRGIPGNIDSSSSLMNPDTTTFKETLPFESSHPRSAYATLLALAEDETMQLSKTLADFAAPDVGYYEGRFYSFFPPGVAAYALPFYLIGQSFNLSLAFAYASIALLAFAALFFIFLIARQVFSLPLWASLAIVLITAFSTPFWGYSLMLYQHIPAVTLFSFAFYAAWKYKQQGKASWLWALGVWTAYGASTFFDYVNIILFLPIIAYLLYSAFSLQKQKSGSMRVAIRSSVVVTSIAVFLLAGLHMFYNVQHFDSPKRFSNALPLYDRTNLEELQGADTRAIAEEKEQTASIFKETNVINGLRVLLFSPDKGLFVYAPVFLFSLCGIWSVRKRISAELLALLGMTAGTLLLYASFGDPWGGWAYGPRYLVPITWILALFCAFWLRNGPFRWLRALFVSLAFLFSAGVALLGILTVMITPPRVEAESLGISWQYWEKFPSLTDGGGNGSLLYNTVFYQYVSLFEYGIVLLGIIALLVLFIFFILPRFRYGN